jgi:glutamate formiminotransferase/formiminotetrahydrofolate cyclodeaminase
MQRPIIECVPNISEGRNLTIIDRIIESINQTEDCSVLGIEPDADYNRTVVTIAGAPDEVYQAAYQLIKTSIELIDMTLHEGEHPRLGVVDVCPFIPLQNYSMDQCVELANRLAKQIANEFNVCTFLYGYAATKPERKLLSTLRKGEYEGLESRLNRTDEVHSEITMLPDFGPQAWCQEVRKSGGITIGARDILVAYNVNVDETDAKVAKIIGSIVRGSGRLLKSNTGQKLRVRGMIQEIQGMGVTLETHGISQVSMNILDVNKCPIHKAFEICHSIAQDHSTNLLGSELVGLVPLSAMLDAGRWYCDNPNPSDDELVSSAIDGLGLSSLETFEPQQRIIEWALQGDSQ